MVGDVYEFRFMRWEVAKTFWRNGEQWARLKCLTKRKKPWDVPMTFLTLMEKKRKVS